MDYKFRKLKLKSGKEQLLMDFIPSSSTLSSFIESDVNSFSEIVLKTIDEVKETKEVKEMAFNVSFVQMGPEYTKIENQIEEKYCILRTEDLIRFIDIYLKTKIFDNKVS